MIVLADIADKMGVVMAVDSTGTFLVPRKYDFPDDTYARAELKERRRITAPPPEELELLEAA